MTKDRLPDLKRAQTCDYNIEFLNETNCSEMDSFVEEVELIREDIEIIFQNNKQIKGIHSDILSEPQTDDKQRQQLEDLLADIKHIAIKVRLRLQNMEQMTEELENTSMSATNIRIRRTQHSMLSKYYVEVMTDINQIQVNHIEMLREKFKRQILITGRVVSESDIDQMIEDGNIKIFTRDIITETKIAKQALDDIVARHQDIIKLEKGLRELNDLFMDMALLVREQGEQLDQIEYHVRSAGEYIERTVPEIEIIVDNNAVKRKRMCICLLIWVFLLIFIIIGLYLD